MRWPDISSITSRRSSLGRGKDGKPVYLRDIWPTQKEVAETVSSAIDSEMFRHQYSTVTDGDELAER